MLLTSKKDLQLDSMIKTKRSGQIDRVQDHKLTTGKIRRWNNGRGTNRELAMGICFVTPNVYQTAGCPGRKLPGDHFISQKMPHPEADTAIGRLHLSLNSGLVSQAHFSNPLCDIYQNLTFFSRAGKVMLRQRR